MPKTTTAPRKRPSTMSTEEYLRISRQADAYYDAGDYEKGDATLALLPIGAEMGVYILQTLGEEALKRFNTKDVEAYYGNDWIERFRK